MPHRGLAALVAAVALSPVALAGCSGGDESEATPEDRLAAAKTNLDETAGVRLTLSADDLPKGVDGLVDASGVGTHDPAFEGDIKVASAGLRFDVSVVAVDGVVYAKLPYTSAFTEVDPGDYGAPDPADLMATEGGLSSLLTAVQDPQQGEQVRDGEVVLSAFSGTVPGEAVASVIPSARADADFDADLTLDGQDRLNQIELTGPFYDDADEVTYTFDVEQYGIEKDIAAP